MIELDKSKILEVKAKDQGWKPANFDLDLKPYLNTFSVDDARLNTPDWSSDNPFNKIWIQWQFY